MTEPEAEEADDAPTIEASNSICFLHLCKFQCDVVLLGKVDARAIQQ